MDIHTKVIEDIQMMLVNSTLPSWKDAWASLDAPNVTVADVENGTNDGDADLLSGGVSDEGFWWDELEGDDFPPLKFGPNFDFLQSLPVYINLLLVVVALVLVIGIACKCVAAKVRLTLNRRRGPEIAFQLGATGDVIERVVATEASGRQCGDDGDRSRGPCGHAI